MVNWLNLGNALRLNLGNALQLNEICCVSEKDVVAILQRNTMCRSLSTMGPYVDTPTFSIFSSACRVK